MDAEANAVDENGSHDTVDAEGDGEPQQTEQTEPWEQLTGKARQSARKNAKKALKKRAKTAGS